MYGGSKKPLFIAEERLLLYSLNLPSEKVLQNGIQGLICV